MARFTRRSVHHPLADAVAVLGLGRFGLNLALELMSMGAEVLGVDSGEEIVQHVNGQLTHVVRADTTDAQALDELKIGDFSRVVVGIGSNLESSILTSSLVLDLGCEVWAKATGPAHGRILSQLGVHHVVYPEAEMGRRTAHRVRGALLDFIEVGTDFAVVRTRLADQLAGQPVDQQKLWDEHRVTLIAAKDDSVGWSPVLPGQVIERGTIVQIIGKTPDVEAFARVR